MSLRIITAQNILEERRNGTREYQVPYVFRGQTHYALARVVNGEMEILELTRPIGEMLVSDMSRKELLEKVTLDFALGEEEVPLLYGSIYEILTNSEFPEVFDAPWAQYGVVIFLEHFEGDEIKFGSLKAEEGPIARIKSYTAGFQYTKEMQLFNRVWDFEELTRAMGRAYNALLNHLHLGPFITYPAASWKAANKTAPVYVDENDKPLPSADGRHYILSLRATLKKAQKDAADAGRPGSVLLTRSTNIQDIKDAMGRIIQNQTEFQPLEGISAIIGYDGWSIQVAKKKHTYPGVDAKKAYLIRPKGGFKELVKVPFTTEIADGDLTRLIEKAIVGYTFRGVFCAIDENVQEITLPN